MNALILISDLEFRVFFVSLIFRRLRSCLWKFPFGYSWKNGLF